METIIEVKGLTKNFDGLIAVNNLNFSVYKGEIFGFLGPNGAGKTTTIRMLTGLLTPNSGEMFIDGINVRRNPIKAKMKMGVIPEIGNIYAYLTPRQNIILAGRFYGLSRREVAKTADNLLEQFGLKDRKDNPVRTLSKGMKQRVNIASAIVHNPKILFLDEPTSGLDVQSQRLIRNIIKQMNKEGTTCINSWIAIFKLQHKCAIFNHRCGVSFFLFFFSWCSFGVTISSFSVAYYDVLKSYSLPTNFH